MTLHRFPVNPQSTLGERDLYLGGGVLPCVKCGGAAVTYDPLPLCSAHRERDPVVDAMRDEDRRVRRGIGLGILIGGFLLWPTAIAFCWAVALLAGVVKP